MKCINFYWKLEIKEWKEHMTEYAKNLGYNIQMGQWENMGLKGLKFIYIVNYNFKENFYKIMYLWFMWPEKLSRMYEFMLEIWIYPCWVDLQKIQKVLNSNRYTNFEDLKINIQLRPRAFLEGTDRQTVWKKTWNLVLYVTSTAWLLNVQRWKYLIFPQWRNCWWRWLNLQKLAKLISVIRENIHIHCWLETH